MEKHPGTGREGLLESLRHWYDGYRFSEEAEKVYNPVSINSFFRDDGMAFEPYWANTASTEMVVELAKRTRFSFMPGAGVMVDRGVLQNFRIESFAPDAEPDLIEAYGYLYMAGYLTIDSRAGEVYSMSIPNREVEGILTGALADAYVGISGKMSISGRIKEALDKGDMPLLASAFERIIQIPTYDMRVGLERFYQALIYDIAFFSDGVDVRAEEHTAEGRSDLVLAVKGRVVVVELKMNQNAEAALAQIESRGYMDRYIDSGDDIILMGVNIAAKGRGKPRLAYAEKHL